MLAYLSAVKRKFIDAPFSSDIIRKRRRESESESELATADISTLLDVLVWRQFADCRAAEHHAGDDGSVETGIA